MDPLWIDLKRWYYSLYRGQRYLVWMAVALFTLTIVGWVTHGPSERKTNNPIILNKGIR
jgi:hypothetical protein